MNIPRVAIVLLSLAWSPALLAAEPLLWKFSTGDAHQYRMIQRMDMEMTLGEANRKIETSVEQVIDMTWKIDQVDEQGQAQVVQTLDRMRMNMQAPGQPEMKYDTQSKEAPAGFAAMLAPLMKAMTENEFTMAMSPRGKIDDVKMPEAVSRALNNVPGAAMMGEMFSDEGFGNMIQKSSLILPEPQDLEPGHEWSTTSEMKNPQLGKITSKLTYRYLGPRDVEGKQYEVFGIKMEMGFGEGAAGVSIEIEDQNTDGEILFDRAAGRLESSKLQQEINMNIAAGPTEMKQKMVQKVFFERQDKASAE